ncbi:MAG: DUF4258 domain-containing protein [Gallionellaceae bacterium]
MTKPQEFHNEGQVIRKLVCKEGFTLALTKHARQEMKNDELDIVDVVQVLKGCCVIEADGIGDDCKYTAQGKTADSRLVNIVLKLMEDEDKALVITVFEIML